MTNQPKPIVNVVRIETAFGTVESTQFVYVHKSNAIMRHDPIGPSSVPTTEVCPRTIAVSSVPAASAILAALKHYKVPARAKVCVGDGVEAMDGFFVGRDLRFVGGAPWLLSGEADREDGDR